MDHKYAIDEAYCNQPEYQDDYLKVKRKPMTKKSKINNKVFWELANGKKIDIDTMTIEHLKNVLKLIVDKELLKAK